MCPHVRMSGQEEKKGVLLGSVSFSLYCLISFALVLLFLFTLDTIANFRYKNLVIYTHANIITLISLCHEGSPVQVPPTSTDSAPSTPLPFALSLSPLSNHVFLFLLDLWCDASLVFRNLLDKTLGAVSVSDSVSHSSNPPLVKVSSSWQRQRTGLETVTKRSSNNNRSSSSKEQKTVRSRSEVSPIWPLTVVTWDTAMASGYESAQHSLNDPYKYLFQALYTFSPLQRHFALR